MQYRTLGAAAGIVSFCTVAILAVCEVQKWAMPALLGASLIALMLVMGSIALLVVANEIRNAAAPVMRDWGLRWPIYKKKPDPNQRLLDLAREDADNPTRHLYVLKQTVRDIDLRSEIYRPWVEFGILVVNGGINDVLFGPISGYAHLKGNQLPEPVEAGGGKSRKPRGHEHEVRIKVYVPKERAGEIHKELADRGKLCSIGLSGVGIEVSAADLPNARTVTWRLGQSDTFVRPD